jgi:hypothetical protein
LTTKLRGALSPCVEILGGAQIVEWLREKDRADLRRSEIAPEVCGLA